MVEIAGRTSVSFTSTYTGDRDQLQILFPLGVPVVDDDIFTDNDGSVSWSGSTEKFHFYINTDGLRAVLSGGHWSNIGYAGCFCLNLYDVSTFSSNTISCR